jgi:cation diffusion facilitator CzcD-associated flavoprotein CzcO/surfactin synthase thioesterase subunit
MALVPQEPKWNASVSAHAVIPESLAAPVTMDEQTLEQLDATQLKAAKSIIATVTSQEISRDQREQQLSRVVDRCSSEQWLDENEREWYAMDEMCRSRPWASKKDEPFNYPFRICSNEMRMAEGPWAGDDKDPPFERSWTRFEEISGSMRFSNHTGTQVDVLHHLRPVAEHPPSERLILFTPEFGSDLSFDNEIWSTLKPVQSCDIWIVSWQGWSNFDEMMDQLKWRVLSFADATSTVWVAHGMGALVAYELLKIFDKFHTPNLPVAFIPLACPAPHLFKNEYRPWELYPWLSQLKCPRDFEKLTPEQLEVLAREFQVTAVHEVDPDMLELVQRGLASPVVQGKYADAPALSTGQRLSILGDLKVMRSYRFRHEEEKSVQCAVVPMGHDEDPFVSEESMRAWKDYGLPGSEFEYVALEEIADAEELAAVGHGFSRSPSEELVGKVYEIGQKYKLTKEVDYMLPDPGPVEGAIPSEIDCIVVGAGIAGITQAKALVETGRSVIVLDRYRTIGGIWMFYANDFSRVNSSEPAYRIVNQEGLGSRPNEDHSPRHDILRDIFTVAHQYLYDKVRCNIDVVKVQQRNDRSYDVTVKHLKTGEVTCIHSNVVSFNVNRRIGKRRDLNWPGAEKFRGLNVYGYANEVVKLDFWGKRVIVVGAGAFAYENLRTAIEHGAKHVTILGRRAGTTCPKWIDMIAFLRPLDPDYWATNKKGNPISFDAWEKCYKDAGLKTPECWEEGLLKPHNHTVSVSDLAYIAGYHGMVDLRVGTIKCFCNDGHRVELTSGDKIDVDIIIKATGFLLNTEVPKITGEGKIYSFNLLNYNLNYGAEPLLDAGQFAGAKGKVDVQYEDEADDFAVSMGSQKLMELGLPPVMMRANPFGSSYVGGMLSNAYYFKWLVEHPEYQEYLMDTVGRPQGDTVEQWVSSIGSGSMYTIKKLMASLS